MTMGLLIKQMVPDDTQFMNATPLWATVYVQMVYC